MNGSLQKAATKAVTKAAAILLLVSPVASKGASPCVDPAPQNLLEITARMDVQDSTVEDSDILDCVAVPVGSRGDGIGIWRDPENTYDGAPSYKFRMGDDTGTRVELSAAFVTQADLDALGLTKEEIEERVAAKSLYHYGSGFAVPGEVWTYEYGMYLPSTLDDNSKGIISQWHGVPDRTTVKDPSGNYTTYSLSDFNSQILTQMYFKETDGYFIGTNITNNYSVDQGGYPPLSLKVDDGYLYLLARVDYSRITDKNDRINTGPPRFKTRKSENRTKEVASPYHVKLNDLPSDEWIDVKFEIAFSTWAANDTGMRSNGSIKMYLNGEKVTDWSGPLGSNDDVGPYFKYGIYKPGPDGMEVSLAGLKYYGPTSSSLCLPQGASCLESVECCSGACEGEYECA